MVKVLLMLAMLGISFPAHAAEKKLIGYACISEFSRYAKQISLYEYKNGVRCFDPKKEIRENSIVFYGNTPLPKHEVPERLVEIWENVDG